jgi:hypothetical protein
MKKLMVLLSVVFFVIQAGAQSTEYLQQKEFQAEKKKIYEGLNASKKQLNEIKKGDAKLTQSLDSIKRIVEINAIQLATCNDSLSKTGAGVTSLKEQFDSQKLISRGMLILLFVIILILFVVVFILLLRFKKSADMNHQVLVDLDKKTNDRIETEIKGLKTDMQGNKDFVSAFSAELSYKISTGLTSLETKFQQLEKQVKDDLSGYGEKLGAMAPEIGILKNDQSLAAKSLEEKLHTLKHEVDLVNQTLAGRAAKLEEELKLLKKK